MHESSVHRFCARLVRASLTALDGEDGATAVEYSIMVGLIAAVIIATVIALGGEVLAMFNALLAAWP